MTSKFKFSDIYSFFSSLLHTNDEYVSVLLELEVLNIILNKQLGNFYFVLLAVSNWASKKAQFVDHFWRQI